MLRNAQIYPGFLLPAMLFKITQESVLDGLDSIGVLFGIDGEPVTPFRPHYVGDSFGDLPVNFPVLMHRAPDSAKTP